MVSILNKSKIDEKEVSEFNSWPNGIFQRQQMNFRSNASYAAVSGISENGDNRPKHMVFAVIGKQFPLKITHTN